MKGFFQKTKIIDIHPFQRNSLCLSHDLVETKVYFFEDGFDVVAAGHRMVSEFLNIQQKRCPGPPNLFLLLNCKVSEVVQLTLGHRQIEQNQ